MAAAAPMTNGAWTVTLPSAECAGRSASKRTGDREAPEPRGAIDPRSGGTALDTRRADKVPSDPHASSCARDFSRVIAANVSPA
jgi:hypothetical protein